MPTIRPATPADTPRILPLVNKICSLHAERDPERFAVRADVLAKYEAWLPIRATDPRSVLLVAEHNNDLIAYTVGTVEPEVPIFWIPECGFLHDLWVEPAYRRQGIAAQLLEEAISSFKAIGVQQLRMHTGIFNDTMRTLAAKHGFRPCLIELLRPL